MGLAIDVVKTCFLSGCVASLLVSSPGIARSLEYQCARGLVIRNIVVEYQVFGQQVPCRVLYDKPSQIPRVLWKARAQAGFCESKADQLLEKLDRSGWCCHQAQGAAPMEASQMPSRLAEPETEPDVPEPAGPREQEAERANIVSSGSEPRGTSLQPAEAEAAAPSEEAAPFKNTRRTEAIAVGPQDTRIGRSENRAFAVELARDLRKLEEGSHTKVEAGDIGFGDLDGDGQRDAALLITFFSGADHLQYLVAYVYREGTYRLAASRFIGGSYREVESGELEAIEAGEISVRLQIAQTEDVACCPLRKQEATFVLENGGLARLKQGNQASMRPRALCTAGDGERQ
jgi:hypothetical protein